MEYTDDRYHLHVNIQAKQFRLAPDELALMQNELAALGGLVQDLPSSDLSINLTRHPQSKTFHVEFRLRLPGRTLFTGDAGEFLIPAFERCVRKIVQMVELDRRNPDERAEEVARRRDELNNGVVAPEDPATDGALGKAAQAGDYRAFRTTISAYEEWLRKRVGRWIQRSPEAQGRLGGDLRIGDLVEEVFLNAFEGYARRPADVPFHEWLDGLIDPSLRMLLRKPGEEQENVSFARTLHETPLGRPR